LPEAGCEFSGDLLCHHTAEDLAAFFSAANGNQTAKNFLSAAVNPDDLKVGLSRRSEKGKEETAARAFVLN
jgi:hypothetical protein